MAKNNNEDLMLGAMEETAPVPEENEQPVMTVMTHTVDEIPELAGKGIGDTITFSINNISDDGKTFDLEYVEEMAPEGETMMAEETMPAGGGRAAIAESFGG